MAHNCRQKFFNGLGSNQQIPGDWDRVAGEGRFFPSVFIKLSLTLMSAVTNITVLCSNSLLW